MRHARVAAKVDDNQKAVKKALEAVGAWVQSIGQPYDLLVWWRGSWSVLEVKDGAKPQREQHLTEGQLKTLADLRLCGVKLVRTPDEALCAIGAKAWPEVVA